MDKITLDHPDSQSADLVANHIDTLSQIFPEVIKEGKVDFEALQDILGNYADTSEERFQLNWAGKSQARREAQKRSTGTLRPCPEDSVDWDTTEHLYIEGDNLEVLKLLQKSYYKKVKMIYIDPPYNTGKDFVYKDNYIDNMTNYLEISGQDRSLGTNTESEGRYHSNWLNMMYPRLKLARNLMTDDGVIFISIDDNEFVNLKKICDEIYGEENFEANIIPIVNPGGRDYKQVAITNEYLLMYSKSSISILNEIPKDIEFPFWDSKGGYNVRELRNRNPKFHSKNRPNLFYPFYVNPNNIKNDYCTVSLEQNESYCIEVKPYNSEGKESVWRWGKIKAKENLVENNHDLSQILAKQKSDGNWNIYEKNRRTTTKIKSVWDETEMRTENGTREVRGLFGNTFFDHPKPVELIKRSVLVGTEENDLILDFFSGSATTAHAVMQLNSEDGGNRRYIMVQLPESTPEDSDARKTGYKTIAEIGKERIRRAGKKIVEELKAKQAKEGALFAEEPKKLDIGFKVFKLDSSNINTWDSSPSNLEGALYNSVQNIKSDRTELDLLYEILLKYGIDLVQPINEHVLVGKKVYEMGAGALIVCMADHVKPEVAEAIAQLWKEVKPTTIDESSKAAINCRVVFKDNGFDDNNDKTNVLQILKQHGIDNVVTI